MDINSALKLIGLNQSEITVYLFLLENGATTPPIVSHETKIARTNCYNILGELKVKGLIEEQERGKRKAYLAKNPEALIQSLEKRKELVQRILPDLQGLYTTQKNKPKIRFYDGLEEIKDIYEQSLQSEKVMMVGSIEQLHALLPGYLEHYFVEVKKRGIIVYQILGEYRNEFNKTKELLNDLYDTRLLPPEYKDMPTNILLWNDTIALIALSEPAFGTMLTNQMLAKTFQMLFEIIWKKIENVSHETLPVLSPPT